jgi:hypothetical protein
VRGPIAAHSGSDGRKSAGFRLFPLFETGGGAGQLVAAELL